MFMYNFSLIFCGISHCTIKKSCHINFTRNFKCIRIGRFELVFG